MTGPNMDIEILVHIAAPTTRRDDEIYRSLAEAYSEFEPYEPNTPEESALPEKRVPLKPATDDSRSSFPGSASRWEATGLSETPHSAIRHRSSKKDEVTAPGSDDSYGSFPSSASFTDRSYDKKSTSQYSQSQREEPSQLSQSRSRIEQLERIQARWKSSAPQPVPSSRELRSSGRSPVSIADEGPLFIEDTQLAALAVESQLYDDFTFPSQSDPGSPVPSGEQIEREKFGSQASGEKLNRHSESPEKPTASRVQSTPLVELDTNSYQPVEEMRALVEQPAPSQGLNHSDEMELVDAHAEYESFDFSQLPSMVLPLPPRISVKKPSAFPFQVTDELAAVLQQNQKRFQPTRRMRRLLPDERGYWLIDTSTWPPKRQVDFWESLSANVRRGALGWGVTLHRESSGPKEPSQQQSNKLGSIRLYCWGEIVEHVWVYLWLFSKGKIVGSRASWIDAGETVVIQMS